MPNSLDREAFEAAYRKIYPATYPTITPNAFERDHDGYYIRTPIQEAWEWWQAGAAAERQKKITVPDQMQEWKGMDGAIAFHLIERHANGWDDASTMMHEWLEANRDRSAP